MDRWFSTPDHDVKIAKFNHSQSEILLEKWEETLQSVAVRPGATTMRAAAASGHRLASILRQSITITRNTATNPPLYNVAGGALVISFCQSLRGLRIWESCARQRLNSSLSEGNLRLSIYITVTPVGGIFSGVRGWALGSHPC